MRSLLRLFDRPRPARSAQEPAVGLTAGSSAESQPTSGLLTVELAAKAAAPTTATLRVFVGAAATPAFEKPLSFGPQELRTWVAIHGHLVANGPLAVRLELADAAGAVLAQTRLTLKVRNEGELAEITRRSLTSRGVALVVDELDARLYDYADDSLAAWYDRSPEAIEAHLKMLGDTGQASPEEVEALRQFTRDGFMVVPGVVDEDLLSRLNAALDDAVAKKVEGYEWGVSQRLHNLHLQYPAIRELWLHAKVIRMLRLIFGAAGRPCQSLTYVFGSQQEHHQDTIHLTSFPAGRMCGVWTALEDVQPDSGELVVFPGSHRLPRVYMKDAGIPKVGEDWSQFGETVTPLWTRLLDNKFRREVYRPKAGTVLIWHENLMHAGSMRLDMSKSRRSIVGHYFAEGAVVYYDSSGMPGVLYEGELPA
ncbi:phytanoyl-CoA dioxygenase family protein [Phenylobacterium soli]|uniref:phytanoyl-CoA dioxygenase family protein n=1 Tax=Phenylobacterium soli TaxID=2170551 RepID=UPI001403850B|nr:phytanoyl-CoA dioxygenase family protein [Phenylobacterium soli]